VKVCGFGLITSELGLRLSELDCVSARSCFVGCISGLRYVVVAMSVVCEVSSVCVPGAV